MRSLVEAVGFAPSGFFFFFWVVPGAVFVLIVLLAYLRFLANLPKKTRRLFLVAGTLFVVGALGIEMLYGQLVSFYGSEDSLSGNVKAVAAILTAIEELLEMSGIVVFVYTLLSYVSLHVGEVTVQVYVDNE